MNLKRVFTIKKHDEYGNIGLAPTWMHEGQTDPLEGMGNAHDILEHGNNDPCEWPGLGGSVYVRGPEYFARKSVGNPNPVDNIAGDFFNLYCLWQGEDIPDPGPTRPLRDDWAEEMIQDCVREGCKSIREESGREKAAKHFTRDVQQQRMIGWMRKGYRATHKRWSKVTAKALTETFVAIEDAANRFLKYYGTEDYIGAKVTISFNPIMCQAHVEMDEGYYEDYR